MWINSKRLALGRRVIILPAGKSSTVLIEVVCCVTDILKYERIDKNDYASECKIMCLDDNEVVSDDVNQPFTNEIMKILKGTCNLADD